MDDRYSPQQIADDVGVCALTVRRYLHDNFSAHHEDGEWWKLSRDQFEFACGQLRAGKLSGTGQPRREIKKHGPFLPF